MNTTAETIHNSSLLSEQELMTWLDCRQRADLERRLRQKGIPVIYGRGGKVCTTLQAVNDALTGNINSTGTVEF